MSRIQLKLMAALTALVVAVVAAAGFLTADSLREHELSRIDHSLLQRGELIALAMDDPYASTPLNMVWKSNNKGKALKWLVQNFRSAQSRRSP